MVDGVRGEGGADFPEGVDDQELIVRYHELLTAKAKESFPFDPRAATYIVGQRGHASEQEWEEIEDQCFWEAAMELSERAGN